MELAGYLLEELRDAKNFENFKKDVASGACKRTGGLWVPGGRRRVQAAFRAHARLACGPSKSAVAEVQHPVFAPPWWCSEHLHRLAHLH